MEKVEQRVIKVMSVEELAIGAEAHKRDGMKALQKGDSALYGRHTRKANAMLVEAVERSNDYASVMREARAILKK